MKRQVLRLKKNEDRRIRNGHVWIYSNEVASSLKDFTAGEEVVIEAHDKTLLGVAFVNPHSLITARLFSRNPQELFNQDFLIKKIKQAKLFRDRFFREPFYRLIFSDSDGLPGIVADRFDDTVSLQLNIAGVDTKTDLIIESLLAAVPEIQAILLRNDSPIRKQEGLETFVRSGFGSPKDIVQVKENGVMFEVPLWQGQKTGWFYDHRLNRLRLMDYVRNRRVLDVFSYLGAFGVQAAVFGAKQVTCIDESKLSADWIQKNAEKNNVAEKVSVITEDAFTALKNLKEKFDVIILDPPAFMKRQKDKKEGFIAYQRLNEAAIKCLSPEGILFSCSCSMHLSMDDLAEVLKRASHRANSSLQILERGHQGPDHPIHLSIPETDYLKMIVARRISI
ncbi:MAG TPA: class I SAM-dependent rRNA methyltransferase [Gammaproteobacteria bacterium]|nr:class I SAM-dependent rRNA methyltransferase [Gammaproteobacteria bacterium]